LPRGTANALAKSISGLSNTSFHCHWRNHRLDRRKGEMLLDQKEGDAPFARKESLRAEKCLPMQDLGDWNSVLRLPLVSVVIVNYNYARFLGAAVDSVFRQTYPNIECVVVENGSTDESARVLRALEGRHVNIKTIYWTENDGQTKAILAGLARSSGTYVIFLDADDFLLPDCVETHIFVHLSLRVHVGFTSGDMLQLAGNQIVLGTENGFNRLLQTRRGIRRRRVRPFWHPAGKKWPAPEFDQSVLDTIRFVGATPIWLWSPTSGNCFRRDALDLFADNPELQNLKIGTDLYFCLAVNAICGSVLIDKPLAVYRLHGANKYSKRPQLNNVLSGEPKGLDDHHAKAKSAVASHLVLRASRFAGRGWTWIEYLWLLWRMDCPDLSPDAPRWARRSRSAAAIVNNYDSMSQLFGEWPVKAWLALRRVPPNIIFGLGKKSENNGAPDGLNT
jgi:glycosyltransferase involved in cell wall biosynthesis